MRIKIFLIALLVLSAHMGFSQSKVTQFLTGTGTKGVVRDQLQIDSLVFMPLRSDTNFTPGRAGAQVFRLADSQMYYYNGSRWVFIGTGSGSVASITAGNGLTGGTITTSGAIAVDTFQMATRARVKKSIDSLALLLGTTYTFSDGVFNTSGNVKADTTLLATRARLKKSIDSLSLLITQKYVVNYPTGGFSDSLVVNSNDTSYVKPQAIGFGLYQDDYDTYILRGVDTGNITTRARLKKVADSIAALVVAEFGYQYFYNGIPGGDTLFTFLSDTVTIARSLVFGYGLQRDDVTTADSSLGMMADTLEVVSWPRLQKVADSILAVAPNFANTDLTFTANRSHDRGVYELFITGDDDASMEFRDYSVSMFAGDSYLALQGKRNAGFYYPRMEFAVVYDTTYTSRINFNVEGTATQPRVDYSVSLASGQFIQAQSAYLTGEARMDYTWDNFSNPGVYYMHGAGDSTRVIFPVSGTTNTGAWALAHDTTTGRIVRIPVSGGGGSGTVTSVGPGYGTAFSAFTTSGTVIVDTAAMATRARVQKGIDSLGAIISGGSGWNITGNTLSADGIFGTLSNHDIHFYTNNVKRGEIDNNGVLLWAGASPVSTYKANFADTSNFTAIRLGGASRTTGSSGGNALLSLYSSGSSANSMFSVFSGLSSNPILSITEGGTFSVPSVWAALGSTSMRMAGVTNTWSVTNLGGTSTALHTFTGVSSATASGTLINLLGTFAPTTGSGAYTSFSVTPTITQTGSASGTVRGFLFNPILTGLLGELRAIDIAAGKTFLQSLIVKTVAPATTSDYTVTYNDYYVRLVDLTTQGASRNIVLPTIDNGRVLVIVNTNSDATFKWSFSGGTVEDAAGGAVTTLTDGKTYTLVAENSKWYITSFY